MPPMGTADAGNSCCFQEAAESGSCHQEPSGATEDTATDCQRMFSCHICVLLAVVPLLSEPSFAKLPVWQAVFYEPGHPSGYPATDWKPPRVA